MIAGIIFIFIYYTVLLKYTILQIAKVDVFFPNMNFCHKFYIKLWIESTF